ncbi:916d8ef6-3fd9-4763-9461-5b903b1ba57b [Sclerotinia trifoliorum]|uniref:916d8ef6-3fd9-4763-9461-5b903b1ba57b n=1 Tax=Sclerotinia trifoliorum TaxID=28548 RepID=A0A8H2ZPN5_9HELO|nr:916d8ef6-3fd9-4763-9461-5b903b1ba57b [Sclerotinia trifoliorum]
MSRMGRQQSYACGPNSCPHQKPGRFSLWPGRRATTTITTREEPAIANSSGLMIDPPHSDLIVSSPVSPPEIEPTKCNLSQDLFIGALHDPNYIQLQENVRRLRRALVGPEPKNVDATWEIYKRQREQSLKHCRKLIEKSQEHYARNPSFESNIGPLDTRSSVSSGSGNDASLPFQINNQWLSAIRDYKAFQETLLNTLHTSLVVTYTAYEPDASQRQLEIFLADKEHRKSVITKWRDTSVRRVRSEKPEFFEKYKIRSLNFDKLKHDIEESESLFETGHAQNRVVRESVIYKNGDTILEFANRPSDRLPIIRFRVSSHFLSPDDVSPLFFHMLSPGPNIPVNMMNDLPKAPSRIVEKDGKDGNRVNVYRMPQMEPNNHEALALLLHAIHGHTQKLPKDDINFPLFVSIADVCLRYRCTSPVELQVEYRWLPQWESRAAESNPEELLLIAYTFGARDLFTRISRSIILNSKDDGDTQGTELWPQVIKDSIRARRAIYMEQVIDYCASVINEYLQRPQQNAERSIHVGSLELSTVRCPRGSRTCDATNLGWLMLVYNELGISPLFPKLLSKCSLKELIGCLRLMPSPPQTHIGVCDFAPNFRSKINDISNTIIGLTLHDVSGKHGWALSKGKGPQNMAPEEIFELPAQISTKACIIEAEKAKEATRDAISLRILSLLDNFEDLHAAAMIDKTFYKAYINNEGRLLRNIVKAGLKNVSSAAETQISPPDRTNQDTAEPLEATSVDLIDDSESAVSPISESEAFTAPDEDLYDVSPPLTPADISAMPIPTSQEEARELLIRNVEATSRAWAMRDSPQHQRRNEDLIQNEKFLAGDFSHVEDKALIEEESKLLRLGRDVVMNVLRQ